MQVMTYTPDAPMNIGTRGSPLALAQAYETRARLMAALDLPEDAFKIHAIKTTGDRVQDRALAEIGGKALWTKELDFALDAGEIYCAVHSMKDVETIRPAEFAIAAMLERADVRDRLVGAASIDALKHGARVGTASPRRTAQLLRLRPDLSIGLIRGNVATRLARIESGEFDATLLAAAGLSRLGEEVGTPIPVKTLLPAPSQGAIGIECCAGDEALVRFLAAIDHEPTSRCVRVERAFLEALGADCHSPVAAQAEVTEGDGWHFTARLYSGDGAQMIEGACAGAGGDHTPAAALARRMLSEAHPEIAKLFPG